MKKILIADDDPPLRGLLRLVASRAGFEVDSATNGAEALEKIRTNTYAVAVIDLMMPRLSGYEVVDYLAEMASRPQVIVVTAMNDARLARLNSSVVSSILRKPFDIEMLWDQMFRSSLPYGRKGLPIMAISAVDVALWDLIGKAKGEPVWRLLGGKTKDAIPIYSTGNDVAKYHELGFTRFKLAMQLKLVFSLVPGATPK